MATNLAQMSPILGANTNQGGMQQSVPGGSVGSMPSIGGTDNPLLPQFPAGQSTFGTNAPIYGSPQSVSQGQAPMSPTSNMVSSGSQPIKATGATATTGGPAPYDTSATTGLSNTNLTGLLGGLLNSNSNETPQQGASNFVKSMKKAGYSDAVAGALWNFINNGAGYNPQVAQALIASMQPQIKAGEADVMGKFGAGGMGDSSAAALGLSNFDAQAQLNEGQILSNLYEQSVQNYMTVLMGGKGKPQDNNSTFSNILQWEQTAGQNMASAAAMGG